MKMTWVQIDPDTQLAVRIFKNHKSMSASVSDFFHDKYAKYMDRGLAVSQIRRQVWNRQEGLCARCPEIITKFTMEMHERHHKGQFINMKSGEVSLENCEGLCHQCHVDAHPEKQVMFTKRTEEE